MLTLSAIIPTKNRPDDLRAAVVSILAQTSQATEIIVIDQSESTASRDIVEGQLAGSEQPRLVYVHDRSVSGLVDAKRLAVERASSEIVAFLEDDVVLEADYFAQLRAGFDQRPDMDGCGGVITNSPRTSRLFVALQGVFLRGIFKDPRTRIFAALPAGGDLIRCDVLSGGVSAWRAQVFDTVKFDTRNGFHMFEDMEFSTRVVEALGHRLYINPRARLAHYGSPVNRDVHGSRQFRKLAEAAVFFRKRRHWPGAVSGLLMGGVWWFGEALFRSAQLRSPGPVRGFWRGLLEGLRRPLAGD